MPSLREPIFRHTHSPGNSKCLLCDLCVHSHNTDTCLSCVCTLVLSPVSKGRDGTQLVKILGRPLRPQYVKLSEREEGYCVVCNHTDTHSSLTRWKNGKAVARRPHSRPTQTCMPHACTLSHRNLKQRQWKLYGRLKGFVHPTPLHVLPQAYTERFPSWIMSFGFISMSKRTGIIIKVFQTVKKAFCWCFSFFVFQLSNSRPQHSSSCQSSVENEVSLFFYEVESKECYILVSL